MGTKERTHRPSRAPLAAAEPAALIGDYRAILASVANILVNCGYSPDELVLEMTRVCGGLRPPRTPFDRGNLEYVARLPDVIADWNQLPRFVRDGQPRPLPLRGPEPSLRTLIASIFPDLDLQPIVQSLRTMGAIRKRRGLYECRVRHLVFKGNEAYWRALISLHGLIQTMETNLRGGAGAFEQSAISARLPARDRAEMGAIAQRRGLPVLHGLDAELRRRAREAPSKDGRVFAGFGMYMIDIPLSSPRVPPRRSTQRSKPRKRTRPRGR